MSEIDKIIDAILTAEGGSTVTNDPADGGGRTQYGISERSNPSAWADGKVTEEEARAIYLRRYVQGPGFGGIVDRRLQHLLVDWGVLSGPAIVIQELQRAVGAKVDGQLGPKTLAAANGEDAGKLRLRLVDARIRMMCRIVERNHTQARFIVGWVNRALEFRV